jgi:excisionase family DNA binding protein
MQQEKLPMVPDYPRLIYATLARIEARLASGETALTSHHQAIKPTLTVAEAAVLLGVSKSTMKQLVRTDRIASVRVGRRLLVIRASVMALVAV